MRTNIILIGFMIILFGFLLWVGIGYPIEIIGTIGLINIIIGIVTPRSPGIKFQLDQAGPAKLIVDQASYRAGTYELVFSDNKLVMKKLAGRGLVMGVALVFAIIGGLIGGLTGFSIGELMAARKRERIVRENSLVSVTTGDLEIPYESMSRVQLTKNRLMLTNGITPMIIVVSRKYVARITPTLGHLIPGRAWAAQA